MQDNKRTARARIEKYSRGALAAIVAVGLCLPMTPISANAIETETGETAAVEAATGENTFTQTDTVASSSVSTDANVEGNGDENTNKTTETSIGSEFDSEPDDALINQPEDDSDGGGANSTMTDETDNDTDSQPGVAYDADMQILSIDGANGIDWMDFINDPDFDTWTGAETLKLSNLTINTDAFRKFSELTSIEMSNVNIPDTLYPFNGAGSENGVAVHAIGGTFGKYAFFHFNNMTSIDFVDANIPEKAYVFNQAGSPDGFTMTFTGGTMSPYAFGSSVNLVSAHISNGDVADRAFQSCTKLADVSFENVGNIGEYAFQKCGIVTLELSGVKTTSDGAFSFNNSMTSLHIDGVENIGKHLVYGCEALTDADIANCGEIGYRSFRNAPALEAVAISNTKTVGWLAFENCKALANVSFDGVDFIEGGAFEGCDVLNNLIVPAETKLGYVDAERNLIGVIDNVTDRIEQILKGKFSLDSAPGIVEISADNGAWDSVTAGKSDNWDAYDDGTQIVQKARWTDDDATQATVEVDAYYTAEKQMDYIFVLDLSNSMTLIGNPADNNARFYDMQSKLIDVSSKLLGSDGYDCRVAFVTFGSTSSEILGFYDDADDAKNAIYALSPYYENTNYGLGLMGAKGLVKTQDADRATTVVMISDGQPRGEGDDIDGVIGGEALAELGVPVFGVLQSVPDDELDGAKAAMGNVCSEGKVFEANDTNGFSNAVNAAISSAYKEHTVTVPVNDAFENVRNIRVSEGGGSAVLSDDGESIIWTVAGMPFTKHTLSYDMDLADEYVGIYGDYPVNNGNAFIENGAKADSPVLVRTENVILVPEPTPDPEPVPGEDPTPTPDPVPVPVPDPTPAPGNNPEPVPTPGTSVTVPVTVSTVPPTIVPDASDGADNVPSATVPTPAAFNTTVTTTPANNGVDPQVGTDNGVETEIENDPVPMVSPEDVDDDPNPLSEGHGAECWVHWLIIAGIIITVIYFACVIARRKRLIDQLDKQEENILKAHEGNKEGDFNA